MSLANDNCRGSDTVVYTGGEIAAEEHASQ
jgi:hypothetical protein